MTKQSPQRYTATMAKLFADQGYLRKAAEIYRHLVDQDPGCLELREALDSIECRIAEQPAPTRKDTEMLLREWIDLMKQKKQHHRN